MSLYLFNDKKIRRIKLGCDFAKYFFDEKFDKTDNVIAIISNNRIANHKLLQRTNLRIPVVRDLPL